MKAFILNGDEKSQKLIIQACIPFIELKEKVRFSFRNDPSEDPYLTNNSIKDNNYQRNINDNKIKEMVQFLKDAILQDYKKSQVAVIYPTAMLLAFNLEETAFNIGKWFDITLPKDDVYIVDGQHRLYSMISLYNEASSSFLDDDIIIKKYLEKFTFNCTLLMNFDMWEQGQVFADVNFKQKPVSKSLYYDIYGIQYPDNSTDRNKNFIYIAHQLVSFMNTNKKSPFYHCIKMLGAGKGFFSQACLVEALMKHMATPMGIWYIKFTSDEKKPNYRYMAVELISFYTCVRTVFDKYWPQGYKHTSILCKTTGINALTKLMGYIHNILNLRDQFDFEELKYSGDYTNNDYISVIKPILNKLVPYADELFSLNGNYGGTGGSGLSSKLYKRMCYLIEH